MPQCTICEKSFTTEYSLQRHRVSIHKEPKIVKKKRSKRFFSKERPKCTSHNLRGMCGDDITQEKADEFLAEHTCVTQSTLQCMPTTCNRGLVCTRRIESGTTLGWYTGTLLTDTEARESVSRYIATLQYRPWWISLQDWKDGLQHVDAQHTDNNKLRYINSSIGTRRCANVRIFDNGEFRCIRPIRPGQELLAEYNFDKHSDKDDVSNIEEGICESLNSLRL